MDKKRYAENWGSKEGSKFEENIRADYDNATKGGWSELIKSKDTKWANKRRKYYERNGQSPDQVEKMRNNNISQVNKLMERDKQVQKQNQLFKIKESRYNPHYK